MSETFLLSLYSLETATVVPRKNVIWIPAKRSTHTVPTSKPVPDPTAKRKSFFLDRLKPLLRFYLMKADIERHGAATITNYRYRCGRLI